MNYECKRVVILRRLGGLKASLLQRIRCRLWLFSLFLIGFAPWSRRLFHIYVHADHPAGKRMSPKADTLIPYPNKTSSNTLNKYAARARSLQLLLLHSR